LPPDRKHTEDLVAGPDRFRLMLATLVAALLAAAVPLGAPAGARDGDATILRLVQAMTLEEKVGQLFVTHAYGDRVDTTDPADVAANRAAYGVDNAAQLIDRYHPGGIIYFSWSNNVKNPQQIAGLSNGIQRVAMRQRLPIPLLVNVDQEGGIVARVGPPATQFPGNMALGAGRRVEDSYRAARIAAKELRAVGITADYAPVADVNVNPANPVIGVRSFGADTELVSSMTAAQVRGYQSAGVTATAKHFPGHGDTDIDSHTGVPVITHTNEEWERIDLPPFQAAIRRGIDSIMTAHIIVPALDPAGDPATLSRPIITGILRDRLRFDGVVVTDALGMQGVRDKYGDERIPVLALKAGVDQLLMPPEGSFALEYDAVLNAVRGGEISESRIDQSVSRILRLKRKLGLFQSPYVAEDEVSEIVGTPDHVAAAQQITDRTTTLIKNDTGLLPLAGGHRKVLVTGWDVTTTQTLASDVARRGPSTSAYQTGINPTQPQIDAAVAQARDHDLVVVTTNRAWNITRHGPGQRDLVRALLATGKPVVVAAVRDPYDIACFTEAPTYVATYSYTAPALEALTKVLFGESAPRGKLPVMIPAAGDPGHVLYPYGYGLGYR
jgi:beta-N-acetylhexosaminidase